MFYNDPLGVVISFFAAYGIIVMFIALFPAICFSIACRRLAYKKGYVGYGVSGFFFGMFALLYVVGLPLAKDDCSSRTRTNLGKSLY